MTPLIRLVSLWAQVLQALRAEGTVAIGSAASATRATCAIASERLQARVSRHIPTRHWKIPELPKQGSLLMLARSLHRPSTKHTSAFNNERMRVHLLRLHHDRLLRATVPVGGACVRD
jgi:hypothetical protein